jgi:magnesium-transporting ATPase (P-type)
MGSGCAAAKEASSLVLLDDDIQASLKSLMWGRNIFQNVARFLQFQITVNISICYTVFIGCIFFAETPISPVGLLWINLIMDTFAALALATEPPLKNVIKGNQQNDGAAILSNHVWRQILGVSILNMVIMTIFVFFGAMIGGLHFTNATKLAMDEPDHFNAATKYADQSVEGKLYMESLDKQKLFSYIFNTFVFLQLTNEINCRKVGPSEFNVF